jgi:3-oxoacyl-[acyl-carrier-protein] synthase-1
VTLYLNDMGVVCPLGTGKTEVLERLLACDASGLTPYNELFTGRITVVGRAPSAVAPVPARFADFDCRNNRLLARALDEVAASVAELREEVGSHRIAVVLGTSTSGIATGEDAAAALSAVGRMPSSYHYRQQEIGTPAEFAARYLELEGLRYTISTACSSSAKAFASARRLLLRGHCDAAIVGGADSLCQLTLNGFDALESLAPGPCNPFSANRRGINIGEAACVFVLSKRPSDVRLCGTGESSDGYHISAPDPTGVGAEAALRGALAQAGAEPRSVGYVNLHGTATPKNDETESEVMARIFGVDLPCSSTKSLTGHALGAAGALELGFCWLLLGEANPRRRLPAHRWDGVRDPRLQPLHLVGDGETWQRDVFLSSSFAFGGSNVAIAIGRS